MAAAHIDLLQAAFQKYLEQKQLGKFEPALPYLPYDFEQIDRYQWIAFGGEMVKGELGESTNLLNHWHGLLQQWQAWNRALDGYAELDAWELRKEFVEALAYQALMQPSAIRDALCFVMTNAIHQLRLAMGNGYADHLDGDPITPGKKPRYLTRKDKEKRLGKLMESWLHGSQLMAALRQIDDELYRSATYDYRNRSNHAIGPHLGIGYTRLITRTVVPATQLVNQADGTLIDVLIPGKMSTCYGIGGTPPLDLDKARTVNLEQYHRARACFELFQDLLAKAMTSLPLAKP